MKTKEPICYGYKENADYNKSVKIAGNRVRCYSTAKLAEKYPRGGYSFVGEILEGTEDSNAGFLKTEETMIPISSCGTAKKEKMTDVGFIAVGENRFVAVMKKPHPNRLLWFFVILLTIATVALGVILIGKTAPAAEDPLAVDPNIQPIKSDVLTVSGTVSLDTEAVENAEVTLLLGETVIAKTTTDKNGKYMFGKVANGVYSVSVKNKKNTAVKAIVVDCLSVVSDFSLTDSDLTVQVRITDEKTPAVAVNGLNETAKGHAQEGKHVDVTLVATELADTAVPAQDKNLIVSKSGETAVTFYDFSIFREVFSLAGVSESKDGIFETENPIEIIVPYDSTKDVATYVFRSHGGTSLRFTELGTRPTANYQDGTYFVSADNVFIYTKYFSTYAIGSASAGKVTKGSDAIKYSDEAYVNLTSKKVDMLYEHDSDSTNAARIEIYLVGQNSNLLIAKSGVIPAGNKLETVSLLDGVGAMPSVGTYAGLMKIIYLGTDGNTSANVEIPLSVAVTR